MCEFGECRAMEFKNNTVDQCFLSVCLAMAGVRDQVFPELCSLSWYAGLDFFFFFFWVSCLYHFSFHGMKELWRSLQKTLGVLSVTQEVILQEVSRKGRSWSQAAVVGLPGPSLTGCMNWVLSVLSFAAVEKQGFCKPLSPNSQSPKSEWGRVRILLGCVHYKSLSWGKNIISAGLQGFLKKQCQQQHIKQ